MMTSQRGYSTNHSTGHTTGHTTNHSTIAIALRAVVVVAAVALTVGCATEGATGTATSDALALEPNAVVVQVIDGDTVSADIGGNRTLIRFIGIDTPEKTGGYLPAECFGDIATERTHQLIPPGTQIYLERDAELYDRYDRLLAYVYRAADGLHINLELVASGYADALSFEPNLTHTAAFEDAAAKARTAAAGLWGACGGADTRLS